MQNFKMPVSKTVKNTKGDNERSKIGDVDVTVPTLEEVAEKLQEIKVKEIDKEDGLPIYESAEQNWIFDCIIAMAKAQARNKLAKDSIECKPGLSIATDWATLIAEGSRDGLGLVLMHESRKLFAAFVATLGKNASTSATMIGMFNSPAGLAIQPAEKKARFLSYLEKFMESLTPDNLQRLERPLNAVYMAAKAESDEENEFGG